VSSTRTEQRAQDRQPTVTNALTAAAVRYCAAGWPILPTYHPDADRLVCGYAPPDPQTASAWWSQRPYGIACRTGELFDVLQVPPWLGQRVFATLDHYATVAAVERSLEAAWLFFVTPGSPGIPDLPRGVGVQLHGAGGWVPLPPTSLPGGAVRWVNRPSQLKLPHSLNLQWALVRAVSAARRERASRRRPV
jgi:hypothetical protein